MRKTPVHLWVYNHPFRMISDQVSFFVSTLRQHGYTVSVGRQPCPWSLNVAIENFSSWNRDVLIGFCKSFRKRVAVIMTEHLDFEQGQLFFHGTQLGTESEYMHKATQFARVRHLMECLPYIRCFFVLGDLPELQNISTFLPGLEVRSIPFPKIDNIAIEDSDTSLHISSDLVFTGAMTSYRMKLLAMLKAGGLSVLCPQEFVSRYRRNAMNRTAKIILNIPQREGWRWLSLMRVVAGLHTGRSTISMGTSDVSQIASCCTQLDIREQECISEVKQCVDHWKSMYRKDIIRYSLMAKAFEQRNPFPHDIFEYWAITDRVSV